MEWGKDFRDRKDVKLLGLGEKFGIELMGEK